MQMQLQLSGTGNYHLELAITIMHRVNQGRTRKLIHGSGQNVQLPSKTGKNHPIPYRTIKSHIYPDNTMQMQLQLSRTSHNHHAASKSMQNSKNQSTGQTRTYHCRLEHARSIKHREKPSRAI